MKRILILCEGPTEQEFCKDVLAPYFFNRNILIQAPLIKKPSGGIVHWDKLKKEIETHLKQESAAIITTLVDYYGILEEYNFPGWHEAHKETDKARRMDILENAMIQTLDDDFSHRVFPYIQLHEFEGLLFTDPRTFINNFTEDEFIDFKEFEEIFRAFPNPEEINDGETSAPSKRLLHHIKGYNKIVFGAIIASEIGLTRIREKCPRFNNWIAKIETIGPNQKNYSSGLASDLMDR